VLDDSCLWPEGSAWHPSGCGLGTIQAGLLRAVQALQCPALQRGGRRGGLLIAEQAVHNVVWDRGPASEPGLERRDRGNGSWGGADPQETRGLVVLDGWIEHLREERAHVG